MPTVAFQTLADKPGPQVDSTVPGRHELLFVDAPIGMTWPGVVHCFLVESVYDVAANRRSA
jgi:hypothetical protein